MSCSSFRSPGPFGTTLSLCFIVSQYKGSHEWCLAFAPCGILTDEVVFQRFCDTNGDGKYGCGDSQFDDSDDGDVCVL